MNDWSDKSKQKLKLCIDEIIYLIEKRKSLINNRQLIGICKKFVNIFSAEVDPHIYHEIAETALNSIIKNKYARELMQSTEPDICVKEILKPLTERLPAQTLRSNKKIIRQQFSTPPTIAYLISYLSNFQANEIVLEPSAGTGNLAVWASGFGLQTHTNEIDARRKELLRLASFKPTSFNAEFINDFLPEQIKPGMLLMNPPFSSNGGRTTNNSSKFGFRHAESALERLKKGGKFGIILRNSAGLDVKTGREFWRKMSGKITIKAIIKIAGAEYAKNGTRVDVNVIIGRKNLIEMPHHFNFNAEKIVCISAKTVEAGFIAAKQLNIRLD